MSRASCSLTPAGSSSSSRLRADSWGIAAATSACSPAGVPETMRRPTPRCRPASSAGRAGRCPSAAGGHSGGRCGRRTWWSATTRAIRCPSLRFSSRACRRRGAIFVVHGSGEGPQTGSAAFRLARAAFQRTLARRAVRVSRPVSVSQAGVASIRRLYGVEAGYLPYPLRALPELAVTPQLNAGEPVNVVWVGRLFPEKDPVLAVRAVERLRDERPATLDVYGQGILHVRAGRARPLAPVAEAPRSPRLGGDSTGPGGGACLPLDVGCRQRPGRSAGGALTGHPGRLDPRGGRVPLLPERIAGPVLRSCRGPRRDRVRDRRAVLVLLELPGRLQRERASCSQHGTWMRRPFWRA